MRNGGSSVCTDLLVNPGASLPVITLDENVPQVTLLEAKDENGDPITYTISGGADSRLFIIRPTPPDALFDCLTIEFISSSNVISTRKTGGQQSWPATASARRF